MKSLPLPFFKKKNVIDLRKKDKKRLRTQRNIRISILGIVIAIALYWFLYFMSWSGFGPDSNTSKSVERTTGNGKIISIKETETEYFESAKTLWNWLELAGTIAIPIVLFQFTRREEQRAENLAQAEKERAEKQEILEKKIAANNLCEDALESYIDHISDLLVDKNLYAQTNKSVQDVARIRTITILRRIEKDIERRNRVLNFLRDSGLLEFILEGAMLKKIDFTGADLTQANLSGSNLEEVNFSNAILRNANLHGANLSNSILDKTTLVGANLSNCNLFQASLVLIENPDEKRIKDNDNYTQSITVTQNWVNFSGAKFINSKIKKSNLSGACFEGADLSLSSFDEVYFQHANLKSAVFKEEVLLLQSQMIINLNKRVSFSLFDRQGGIPLKGKAELTSVDLNYAILDSADLSGVVFIDPIPLKRIRYSSQNVAATFPEDFDTSEIELVFDNPPV
ncbi:pentapeptide repeat-containing protein [Nostoc sp. BAE]|nr:pentapeptide repeat-containing protein [Nostoc commune BAE]